MYSYIIKNAVSDDFREYVTQYVDLNWSKFIKNATNENHLFLTNIKDDIIQQEKIKLIEKFGITKWEDDPISGDIISCSITDGVENKTIPTINTNTKKKGVCIKINVVISKPKTNNIITIDDEIVNFEEKDAWMFFPSKQIYKVTPSLEHTVGEVKKKIICNLGIFVRNENLTFLK